MAIPLSIITINYNNSLGLENTIKGVISQSYKNFEFIIIDGGSTDNSVEIINSFSEEINYWVSEKDTGIYNAMNKGIIKSSGEYLLFLNSGDYLVDNNILSKIFDEECTSDIIYGDTVLFWNENKSLIHTYPETLNFSFFLKDNLSHPSTLIKKNLFEKFGLYNEKFRIVSDWLFCLMAINKYNVSYKHVTFPFSVYDMSGVSSSEVGKKKAAEEKEEVLRLE